MTDTATDLQTTLASLNHGDVVRVTFDYRGPVVGTLRHTQSSILAKEMPDALFLDVDEAFLVRYHEGSPGIGVTSVEPWDEDRWFDRLGELWTDYQEKDFEADHCPRSEQGPARLARDEARVAWLDEVKAGPR